MVRMERLELSIFRLKVGSLTNLATFSQEGEEVAHLPPIKRTRQGTPILESGRNSVSIGVDAFSYLSPPTHYATNAPPACVQAGRELNPNSFWLGCTPLPEGIDRSVFLTQLLPLTHKAGGGDSRIRTDNVSSVAHFECAMSRQLHHISKWDFIFVPHPWNIFSIS